MKSLYKALFALSLILLWNACSEEPFNAKPGGSDATGTGKGKSKAEYDAPTLSCADANRSTLTLTVKAGASGAPAGFSVQWMTEAEYAANGNVWYASDDPRLCKASFSGNAYSSRYILASNQEIEIIIGNLTDDNGASTTCNDYLECGTTYVFRSFAHASSVMNRSAFSANATCATSACESVCTYGFGYWKNHGPVPSGNNENEWPVEALTVGDNLYNELELQDIMNAEPGHGPTANALLILAHQLIAAKLNVENGSSDAITINGKTVAEWIADADDFIGGSDLYNNSVQPNAVEVMKDALEDFNTQCEE